MRTGALSIKYFRPQRDGALRIAGCCALEIAAVQRERFAPPKLFILL